MNRTARHFGLLAGAALLIAAEQAPAAVGLIFTNGSASPTATNVSPGSTFGFSVKLTESLATDQISGVDYKINASSSGVFEFLSRNSTVAGDNFNAPNGASDAALQNTILNPNNGTDLGTSTSTGLAVAGPGTYEVADYTFEVLPGTPIGIYTLGFVSTDTAGAPPNYPVGSFNSLGTYTVTVAVPEPAAISLLAAGAGLCLARRKRRS